VAGLSWAGASAAAQPVPQVRLAEVTAESHPYTVWHCARLPIETRFLGSALEVKITEDSRILLQAMSASGARYVAPGDSGTEFWNKGAVANVTWSGQALPTCTEAGAVVTPFRASGNEPFWAIDYDGWQITLQQPGVPARSFDAQVAERRPDGLALQGKEGGETLRLDIGEGVCQDSMSGLMRPYAVALHSGGQALQGCGGDPARVLQGVRWVLKSMGDAALAAPAWIEFLPEGRLAGHNGCNRLMGNYTITGEGITFGQLGTTRMACAPEAMAQGNAVDRYLSAVRGFSVDAEDTLILATGEGELVAKAEAAAPG